MSKNKKQHIVPKTYLKYFSPNDDGKNIAVLHFEHPYKKRCELKDSGDRCFVRKNFYDSRKLDNSKAIEHFLGTRIEPNYNMIIENVYLESPIRNFDWKIRMMEWLIYSKMRSPMWRELLKSNLKAIGYSFSFESEELREEHMQMFYDERVLNFLHTYYDQYLSNKKWHILIAPQSRTWITSDNPGFSINVDSFQKDGVLYPNAYWTNLQHDTVLYFPLSKRYCLRIQPYNETDSPLLNIRNTPVEFEQCSINEFEIIIGWVFCTQHAMLVACNKEELRMFEQIKNGSAS